MKKVYLFDEQGRYLSEYEAQESPLEPGIFITPNLSTSEKPPSVKNGGYCVFYGGKWVVKSPIIEKPKEEDVIKLVTEALIKEKRDVKQQGVLVDGILFDTDDAARLSYIEFMLKLLQNPFYSVKDWRASGDTWVEMNGVLFNKIIAAWELRQKSLYTFLKEKEEELKSKKNIEELLSVSLKYNGV